MEKKYDVFGMCNALYDLQAEVAEAVVGEAGLQKGGMFLLSHEEQQAIVPRVYQSLVNTEAGGSGANTMIGVALLGGTACYTSRVGADEHGRMYREGLAAKGVQPNLGVGNGDTGISLIMVTPDAERTMATYLGQSQSLQPEDVSVADLQASRYLYVTGYLWDTENQKEAVRLAMREANKAGVKVTFSLSDPFCVGRHKDDFRRLLSEHIDVVFANREEAVALAEVDDVREATRTLAKLAGGIAAVTDGGNGSFVAEGDRLYEIPSYPVKPVDTTGAGDMYAAGFLYGLTKDLPLPVCGRIASYAAALVVGKLGPRLPSIDREAVRVLVTTASEEAHS